MITVKLYGLLRIDSGIKEKQLEAATVKEVLQQLEHCGIDLLGIGVELEVHKYVCYSGYDCKTHGFAGYNKATAKWQSDRDGTVISEAEAQAIIARYPRIDQGMRPIIELLDY